MNFQLLKKRDFNALISDTFGFFKSHGKNYFKGFLTINGGLILILMICFYFISTVFMDAFLASVQDSYNSFESSFDDRLKQRSGSLTLLGLIVFFISIFIMLVSYLYPVGYLHKVANEKELSTSLMFEFIKNKLGRSIVFFLASLVTFMPIMIAVMFVLMLLSMIIIGIPLMMIVVPAMLSWFLLSFYDYISTGNRFMTSMGVGFSFLKKKFWPVVGSTVIIYIIINVITSIIVMIPYMIGIVSVFTSIDSMSGSTNGVPDGLSFFMVMMLIAVLLSTLITFILQNLLLVNQGVIYYSSIEERDNTAITSEIDNIGNDSE